MIRADTSVTPRVPVSKCSGKDSARQHVRPQRPDHNFNWGALINLPAHTPLVKRDPKIRLHISPSILPFATFGAVTPFVKANVFLPDCAGLMLVGKSDTTAEWFALTCNITYAEIWQNTGWQCHADIRRSDHLAKHHFQDRGGPQVMYQTRMLFMQFTNEIGGPLLDSKKERKIYNPLKK